MENLAGNKECDVQIEHELTRCGIKIIHGERMDKEVPASITGKLGDVTFIRAWCYWMISGKIPLHVAEELYADPVGKEDIRVAGHCGCPPPKEWVSYLDTGGRKLIASSEFNDDDDGMRRLMEKNPKYRIVDNLEKEGTPFITSYHIDSEIGLRLFADTIKKYLLT